ncbi:MAG: hypothetical protein J7L58_05545 [Thermoplasmata archaeon]|nr:hypothetical protein [Thermoplasmata archaeon]
MRFAGLVVCIVVSILVVAGNFENDFSYETNDKTIKSDLEECSISKQDNKQWYEKPTKIIWFNGTFHRGEIGIKYSKNLWVWYPKGLANLKAKEITQYFGENRLAKIEIELVWENTPLNRVDLDILWKAPYEGRCTFKPDNLTLGKHVEKAIFYYKRDKDWRMWVGAVCWNGIITTELPFSEKIIIYEEPSLEEINVTGKAEAWLETYTVKDVKYSYAQIFSDFRSILRVTPKNISFMKKNGEIFIGDLIYIN